MIRVKSHACFKCFWIYFVQQQYQIETLMNMYILYSVYCISIYPVFCVYVHTQLRYLVSASPSVAWKTSVCNLCLFHLVIYWHTAGGWVNHYDVIPYVPSFCPTFTTSSRHTVGNEADFNFILNVKKINSTAASIPLH